MEGTFEEFSQELVDRRMEYLPEKLKDARVEISTVQRLGSSYQALRLQKPNQEIGVNIRLDKSYSLYQEKRIEAVLASLARELDQLDLSQMENLYQNTSTMMDYEKARNNLYVRCNNIARNEKLLQTCPYQKVGDMAITAHIALDWQSDNLPSYSTLVNHFTLQRLGIDTDTLFQDALENSARRLPLTCVPMKDVIEEMMEFDLQEVDVSDGGFYILSNKQGQFGAASIFYPGVLEGLQERLGDFYLLPSSVHEFLALPDRGGFRANLLEGMVRDVNQSVLREEDYLSDTVYYYDGKTKTIELAREREQRIEREKAPEADRKISVSFRM